MKISTNMFSSVDESINLSVDGTKVAVVGHDESYDAPLAPGNHALSISTSPASFRQGAPKRLAITAEPGKTYTFTAVWSDPERAVLGPELIGEQFLLIKEVTSRAGFEL
jgi:hypothetical protein